MAVPLLNEIMLGAFAFFVENGITVDSATVSSTAKPDTDPATNWTASSIGDVINFKFDKEEVDLPYMKPLSSGGYERVNRKMVTQDFVILKTRQMGELVHRLEMGLGTIATGTAQTPHLTQDRKATGWLRIQGRQLGGSDRFILDWWCEVRVEQTGEWNDKIMEPVLRFTQIKGIAGNSVVFPSGS